VLQASSHAMYDILGPIEMSSVSLQELALPHKNEKVCTPLLIRLHSPESLSGGPTTSISKYHIAKSADQTNISLYLLI